METTPRAISHYTYASDTTIQKWLYSLLEQGLIGEKYSENSYYATLKDNHIGNPETGDYTYNMLVKMISISDYQNAYNAFYTYYNEQMGWIDENPDMVPELVIMNANIEKKRALDGWWPLQGGLKNMDPLQWNTKNPYYPFLISYLRSIPYEPYQKTYEGNAFDEDARLQA